MRLKEIYEILVNTELKQISVGQDENAVISLMNLAMIEVYGKFSILQEEQMITVEEGKTRYRLQDNSQKVLQVYYRNIKTNPLLGNDSFTEVPINDINNEESVFTPQPYVLHIPNAEAGRVYSIMQIVSPPYITKANIELIDIIVPPQFLEPIVNYVAYRAYKSMDGSEQSEISSHLKAYQMACNNVYRNGMANISANTNTKLIDRGMV